MKNTTYAKIAQRNVAVAATVFLAPVFILLIVYIFYPIVDTFYISTLKWNGISANKVNVGLQNWQKLIKDTAFWVAFLHNIIIMVLSIVIQIPIGLALATFLKFIARKSGISKFFKTIWFVPYLMSSVAIGFLFTYALSSSNGILTAFSKLLGGGCIDLLGNSATCLYTIIFIISWQYIPFYMVYCMAGYTNIPIDIYDASLIDGATKAQYFFGIALPLLRPSLVSAAILSLVGSLKYFDLIYVMTGGGLETELMATYMYKLSFKQFNMGYGSTAAAGMFILITAVALLTMKILNRKEDDLT